MTPMDDLEAVARALCINFCNESGYRDVDVRNEHWLRLAPIYFREAKAVIETLKSRGWTPPSEDAPLHTFSVK